MAASIFLRGVWFRDRKWRKVTGIAQYFPNKNPFHGHYYMHRMTLNINLTYTVEPRYKEVGYNKTLLQQGDLAGHSSLYFFYFHPDIQYRQKETP